MHFYQPDGTCHDIMEVFDNEQLREDEAIRRALEIGLVPSTTTILSCLREEHIERWRRKECIEYLLKTIGIKTIGGKPLIDVTDEQIKAAVLYEDDIFNRKGRQVHAYMEKFLLQFPKLPDPAEYEADVPGICKPAVDWLLAHVDKVIFAESRFCDIAEGYAGTSDALLRLKDKTLWLTDFKTKKHSDKYPMHVEPAYWMQLSSYRKHFEKIHGKMRMGNMLLAGPYGYDPTPKLIIREYKADGWKQFVAAKTLWYLQNDAPPYHSHFQGLEPNERPFIIPAKMQKAA